MVQFLVIVVVVCVLAGDHAPRPPGLTLLSPAGIVFLTLAGQAAVGLVAHALLHLAGRRLDRTGAHGIVALADHVSGLARLGAAAWHTVAVFGLGWVDAVRAATGAALALDEISATLPPLLVFAWVWWAGYPVERRLREAALLRALDGGTAVHAPPTRSQHVWMHVRHNMLVVLVPIAALAAWNEITLAALRVADPGGTSAWAAPAHQALQLLGVAAALALLPPVLAQVWSARAIGPGQLHDDLHALCAAQGVRVGSIRVWPTHGSIVNGAVLGIWGRLRCVLLTDALLDHLPREQVLAVMGHEVGHAARAHVPWLCAAALACVGGCTALADAALRSLDTLAPLPPPVAAAATLALWAAALGGGLGLFGWVSRRFEWQADAFAAQHLSGWRCGERAEAVVPIAPAAAHAMIGALQAVSRLNHVPAHRRSFRHGSLARRVANLRALTGQDARALPIDRHVRIIKVACAVALALVLAAAVREALATPLP